MNCTTDGCLRGCLDGAKGLHHRHCPNNLTLYDANVMTAVAGSLSATTGAAAGTTAGGNKEAETRRGEGPEGSTLKDRLDLRQHRTLSRQLPQHRDLRVSIVQGLRMTAAWIETRLRAAPRPLCFWNGY